MRFLTVFRFRQRLQAEDRVHPGYGIFDLHVILAHEHDFAHSRGDSGGEDDVEQEVQQNIHPIVIPADQQQRHAENKDKGAVDEHGVPQHGLAHHTGIVHAEFAVIVDGRLEPVKGEHGLPEGLDHRNAPHILNSLVAHAFQGVLIEPHILLHGRTRHTHHGGKAEGDRDQTGDAVAPVVHKQHHQHAQRHGDRTRHVRQVVRQQRFCRPGHLRHDPAQLSGAHLIRKADGKAGDVAHQRLFHIGGGAERAAVRTDQRADVDKRGQDGEQDGHPPVVYDPCRP